MKTIIQLSQVPPSLNSIWRVNTKPKSGKKASMYKVQRYNTWANAAGWEMNTHNINKHRWNIPVYVTVAMRRPNANSDLDNRLKCLGDLLEAHGILENDKLIHGWNAYWSDSLPEGVAVEIAITSADPVAA